MLSYSILTAVPLTLPILEMRKQKFKGVWDFPTVTWFLSGTQKFDLRADQVQGPHVGTLPAATSFSDVLSRG